MASNYRQYIYDASDKHVLVCAATGTGKTMSVVIPTALTYPASMIVLDVKEEVYRHSAGLRQRLGHRCLKWSPNDQKECARINPLTMVRLGTHREISDCSLIANALCQTDTEGPDSAHWNDISTVLVTGLILHECYVAKIENRSPTLRRVGQHLTPSASKTVEEKLEAIRRFKHDPAGLHNWTNDQGKPTLTHPVVAEKVSDALQRDDGERKSGISTAKKRFDLFSDPLVHYATSETDITPEDLVDGNSPVSLYLVVPPNQQDRLAPVIKLIVLCLLDRLTEAQVKHKHELLWLLDEFPSLGTLKPMKKALAYVRGYGMRFVIICQNLGQIYRDYGRTNDIIPNCHIIVSFAHSPLDIEGAKSLSEALGSFTVQHLSYSIPGRPGLGSKGPSAHVQNTKRDLMTVDEILFSLQHAEKVGKKVVAPGEALVMVFGCRPIKCWQTPCFLDPKMKEWMKIKPINQSPAKSVA
jgi:type IV secretion system protein VirD4